MPSGLNGDLSLLNYWPDNMPSSHSDPLDPFGHLGHLSHLRYLSHLGHLSYLKVLDLKPIDAPLHMFMEEEEHT
jgi:hypothetical protein